MICVGFERYEAYKDSGVDCLGDVPKHWEILRVKDTVNKIGNGVTPKGGSEVYTNQGIPFIRSQNVYDEGLRLVDVSFIPLEIHNEMKGSQLKKGDILINITGASIGRTCVVPAELGAANINQHVAFLRTKYWFNTTYISLFLKSAFIKKYIQFEQNGASKEALNLAQIARIPIVLPKIEEQKAIADYLGVKTAQIDRKIDLLSQKAIKYSKLKQSLINETVTRGLNKTVAMRYSGVEWIGEVPEHWGVKRLKELGFLYSGLSGKKGEDFTDEHEFSGDFIPFVNIANNQYVSITDIKKVIVYPNEKQNKVRKNDLFFLMSSENHDDIGKSALLKHDIADTYLNSFCKGFRFTKKDIVPNFINHLLASEQYRNSLSVEGKGFTRINLKIEKINDLLVIIPPFSEQKAIADYLDTKTAHIDRIVETINIQIDKLKELRKTLINDVITGKIKVSMEGEAV
ncbi:restriction endonuclease subunit S [Ectobacillus panaciterrae]|uniref:restriction endonuclease subunit S n=1 Tax=Ectobacillus panaciterrae TaxID=363872 RepID=UPI0004203718|nr:restriction endonuclease subunit S [Ectobacillus panaciterrae]